jgi:hypothetical protein
MSTVKEVVSRMKTAADSIQYKPGDDINKVLRFGLIESGAGNDQSSFSTWFFAGGDVRHTAAYCHYLLWFAQHDESFSLEQLKEMMQAWVKQPAEFSGYCGFKEFWELAQEMIACLKEVKTKEELMDLLDVMWLYASNLNTWFYLYIPWGAGYLFPLRDEKYFAEGLKFANL